MTKEQYLNEVRPNVDYFVNRYALSKDTQDCHNVLMHQLDYRKAFLDYWDKEFEVVILSKDNLVIKIY
jgi:hypothetical protein